MFTPTEKKHFRSNGDRITVEVQNDHNAFAWRLVVNGKPSPVTSHYSGLLLHEGYVIVTDYWAPNIRPWVPFKRVYAQEVE